MKLNNIDIIKNKLLSKKFRPNIFLINRHIQTISGITLGGNNKILIKAVRKKFSVPNDIIEGDCYWQKNRKKKPIIILVHGIGGSSKSNYILRLIKKAIYNNYNVVALNLRSCGGTEKLSKRLYNAGDSKDLHKVVRSLDKIGFNKIFIIGISLGGNICLKFAGEIKIKIKSLLGIAVISPLIDLDIAQKTIDYNKGNIFYRKKILNSMKKIIIKKYKFFPQYDINELDIINTIREFDQAYHIELGEFKSISQYYDNASSIRFAKKINIPTLIIHSKDDPIIPVNEVIDIINKNKNIIGLIPKYGGHAGFIGNKNINEDGYWAENRIIEFFDYLK